MARASIAPFFVLTFVFTWGLQLPGVLAQRAVLGGDPQLYLPCAGLGIFGPLVAAVTFARRERGGLKALFAPLLHFRVHPGWYAAALVPALLLSVLLELLNLAGRHGRVAYVPGWSGVVFGLVVSVAEEVGWRGFALPRLERRWGGFAASGLLGVLWCLWHVPMFLGQGVPLKLMPVLLLFFVGGSLFFTWLYDGSRGSLVIAVVAHLAVHLNNSHRALPGEVLPLLAHAIVYAALGLFVMKKTLQGPGRRRLIRYARCPEPSTPRASAAVT